MTSRLGVTFAALLCLVGSAYADKPAPAKKPAPAPAKPAEKPEPAGSAAAVEPEVLPVGYLRGPKLIDLGSNAEIDVPAGMVFVQRAQAQELMKKGGNSTEAVLGVILAEGKDWGIVIEYEDVGYIDDDDADKLDANELLKSYKEGTAQQNTVRRQNGVAELFVDGWSENPRYEKAKHQLVWGLNAHAADGPVVNYTTRVLSRNGFLSINLVDGADKIAASKVETAGVLTAAHFKPGFRYEDHKSDDKSSGMGLRALVLGGAGVAIATKGGFIIKLLLIFKKGVIFIVVGIGGFFKWLFGRKKKEEPMVIDEPPHDPTSGPPPSV